MCTYVDDICFVGLENFRNKFIKGMKERLETGSGEMTGFKYIRVNIHENENGVWI